MKYKIIGCGCGILLSVINAHAATPSPQGARVFIIEPQNGAEVMTPVHIKFGAHGMDVVAAGIDKPNSGHHHLFIDGAPAPATNTPIVKDAMHMHFGAGQTEAVVPLPPGMHTLKLVFGDKDHIPHEPVLASETILIMVK